MPRDNILKENLFIIISSLEITELDRLCAIIHITICMTTCWLAGNCHILSDYNWYVCFMGGIFDELDTALGDIEE